MAAKKKTPAKKSAPKKKPTSSAAKKKTSSRAAPKAKKGTFASRKSAPKKGARPAARKSKRPTTKRKTPTKKAAVNKGPKTVARAAPEALALARRIAAVAVDKKAGKVLVIDTRARAEQVGYDYVVLASGESDRQLSAIHEGVDALLKPEGKRAASVEASPDWVCVNYDEGVVAHFFTHDKREMMDLEDMWKDAPRVSL